MMKKRNEFMIDYINIQLFLNYKEKEIIFMIRERVLKNHVQFLFACTYLKIIPI